jgi:hypothetical protein
MNIVRFVKKWPLVLLMVFCHTGHGMRPQVQLIFIYFPED